ncbi:MAG: cobalamin-dependent protein [Candidatus Omnitrophota bacterium]
MKNDILFFNPPQTKKGDCLGNGALLWLASYLKRKKFSAKVFYLDGDFRTTIAKVIGDYNPKYVAVSCKWYTNLYGAILVAREIKKNNKTIKIITGGNTANYFDEELLRQGDFDIVIRGDAEVPLLNILTNKLPINCTVKEKGIIKRHKLQYVQRQNEIKGYTLVPPEEILEHPKDVLSGINFIWTGKGCTQKCFYCGGSSTLQEKLFHRKGVLYRPVEDVIADINILTKYSKSLMFDFTCFPRADEYYAHLFRNISQGKFKMQFHHWRLPSKKIIDQMSRTFKSALIYFDTSTLCEELRKSLSARKLLKTFFSNKELENIIGYCNTKRNMTVGLWNISGLPGERSNHVKEHTRFSRYLIQKYPVVTDIQCFPLSIEPGAILQRHSSRFNMQCRRNSFMDFLHLTKKAFNSDITYPFSEFFRKGGCKNRSFHPYGIYEKGLDPRNSYLKVGKFIKAVERLLQINRRLYSAVFRLSSQMVIHK